LVLDLSPSQFSPIPHGVLMKPLTLVCGFLHSSLLVFSLSVLMPNSKQIDVKAKHRKRKNRRKQKSIEQLGNAKKKTMRELKAIGSLPNIYKDRI